jgi:trehalose 6-phosphate synthase
MNLVAKEGPTVNVRNGVLILSERAGACQQLRDHVLAVTPTDLEGTIQALYQALTMPADERKLHSDALKQSLEAEDITAWLHHQLTDVTTLTLEKLRQAT